MCGKEKLGNIKKTSIRLKYACIARMKKKGKKSARKYGKINLRRKKKTGEGDMNN